LSRSAPRPTQADGRPPAAAHDRAAPACRVARSATRHRLSAAVPDRDARSSTRSRVQRAAAAWTRSTQPARHREGAAAPGPRSPARSTRPREDAHPPAGHRGPQLSLQAREEVTTREVGRVALLQVVGLGRPPAARLRSRKRRCPPDRSCGPTIRPSGSSSSTVTYLAADQETMVTALVAPRIGRKQWLLLVEQGV
jgi:hypothetical protein